VNSKQITVFVRKVAFRRCFSALKSTGGGHFGPKFTGVPLGADPSCWGCKERTSHAN